MLAFSHLFRDHTPRTDNLFAPSRNRSFTVNPADKGQVNRAAASRLDAKPESPRLIEHRIPRFFQP
jgi:hypothetical protein